MGKINTDNYPNRPFSAYQDDDMFVLQDNGGETYTTNVGDIKNLADSRIKLEGVQVNGTDLPITNKKVNVDISGKTDLSVIAYTFNSEMGYFKGAYVTYNGKLYEFNQEHTGAWNPSHVREIDVDEMYVRAGNGGYNSGDYATTEGHSTRAEGEAAHAEGTGTIANSDNQHAGGRYNVADTDNKYAHIVGNGTADNARSNALTLDWDGNLRVSGDIADGNGDATVEGNPVTFDSPFEQDAKSVVVSVKPIQDLHGYDHPWVGGAGKNKLPLTVNGIKAINTSGTWTGNAYTKDGMTFTVLTDNGNNVIGISVNGTTSAYPSLNLPIFSLPTRTYTISAGALRGRLNKNGSQIADISANQSYTFIVDNDSDEYIFYLYPGPSTVDNVTVYPMVRISTESATFAPYSNICPISGIDEVEIGVSDGESEPTTTTLPLPSTLYDADIDVTNGDATSDVTKINCKNLNFSISTSGGGLHWVDLSSKTDIEPISDKMEYLNASDGWNSTIPCISKNSDNEVRIYGSSEFFADGGSYENAEVLYQLITPTTISFTPTDVELLEGTNVVTTNGEKVAVTYGRSLWQDIDALKTDTEGKLDKSDVATIEGDTASKAYSVNEFMLRSDGFYKVTQPIAQNASITASNTTKTTIGAVLTALLNA